jgi:type III pantothenate kinase
MKVFFDIGNSRCKYVTQTANTLSVIQYIELSDLNESWLSSIFIGVTDCLLADVSSSNAPYILATWCNKNDINFELLGSHSESNGVRSAYTVPESFGVDRWLSLLAAHQLFPTKDCLIIDAGTATTIDYLDSKGQHHGGWILAGISTLVSALLNDTANVAAQTTIVDNFSFANNTSDAVNQASWAATLGLVNQAQSDILKKYAVIPANLTIIFTGGNAKVLQQHFAKPSILVDNLIFIGMQVEIGKK